MNVAEDESTLVLDNGAKAVRLGVWKANFLITCLILNSRVTRRT